MPSRIRHASPVLCAAASLSAAAALTVACTAGCSAISPSYASSGLARQVSNGERISAATRALAARQRAAASHAATTPAPADVRRKVAGAQVTAIGDSVMAASAMALAKVLPGIYIDAVPSRQMPAGLAVVRHLAATGRLRRVVVMGLGTNYIVTDKQLAKLLRIIGPHRQLVLVNTYVPDEWSKEVNATDASFVHRHPDVVLADWYDTIKNRMYLLWPDHVHPEMPGTSVYARMVYRAVQATRIVAVSQSTRGL
ncbi:MAG TPA: hypothetical protein VF162_21335 [Streptosporangiaceae bacterium]